MYDEELRAALAAQLDGLPPRQATAAVERLISHYRGRTPTDTPILRDLADATAYAAYRMPATYAAVSAALGELADRLPRWVPTTHLDLGGGTGAATWAVASTWSKTVRSTVLDWATPALDLGRELAGEVLADTSWRRERITDALSLEDCELLTLSYVLGELTEEHRTAAVEAASRAASVVVVVEPGTPEGYLRIMEARRGLTQAGLEVLAPCPHSGDCPIVPGRDWCHFAARVPRSSLHRQVKGGSLGHEDEKFSYVAAVRADRVSPPVPLGGESPSRIVRHPQIRKGQVLIDLCEPDGTLARTTVSKRDKSPYRAARRASWGDVWPPAELDDQH